METIQCYPKSLQDKALVEVLFEYNFDSTPIIVRLLERTINFHKLSESTLWLIWAFYGSNENIRKRIPEKYIKDDWWYDICNACRLRGSDLCDCNLDSDSEFTDSDED